MIANAESAATPPDADGAAGKSAGVYQGHSEEELKEAKEEFEQIDTNKDGFITREEILEMEEVPEREEVDEFFNTYDKNTDNRVTFEEILRADSEVRQRGPNRVSRSLLSAHRVHVFCCSFVERRMAMKQKSFE